MVNKANDISKVAAEFQLTPSQHYLKESSYSISLGDLYKMDEESTCAYNEDMQFTPVQVQVHMNIKKLHFDANFLLQVWNKEAIKIFQVRLKKKVQCWAVCFDFFIYRTDPEDQDSDMFQIYNLKTKAMTFFEAKMFDNSYKYLMFNGNKLYVANSNKIHIIPVRLVSSKINLKEKAIIRRIDENNMSTITFDETSHKIHGLALTTEGLSTETNREDFIHVILEVLAENTISINKLVITKGAMAPYKLKYKFVELRERIRRPMEWQNDPIDEYRYVYAKGGVHVGLARRNQGFDIYYDGTLIDTPFNKDQPRRIIYGEVTFDKIILEMAQSENQSMSSNNQRILLHGRKYDASEQMMGQVLTSNLYFTERIKNCCRLFSGIIVIHSNVFVSHGRFVSQFYLKQQRFELRKKHFIFNDYVDFLFKRLEIDPKTGKKFYSVGILLEDGQIHVVSSYTPMDQNSWELDEQVEKQLNKIEGQIVSHSGDPVQFRCNLFLAVTEDTEQDRPEDKIGKSKNQMDDLWKSYSKIEERTEVKNKLVKIKDIKEIKKQVKAYIYADKLYEITEQLNQYGIQKLDLEDQICGMFEFSTPFSHFILYKPLENKMCLFKCIFQNSRVQLELIQAMPFNILAIISRDFDLKKTNKQQVWHDTNPQKLKFHNAILSNDNLMIFSNVNAYKLKKRQATGKWDFENILLIPELNWRFFTIIDNHYIFCINDSEKQSQRGLCMESVFNLTSTNKNQIKPIWLKYAQVGVQSNIDYGSEIERLAYFKSYNEIIIIPNLCINQTVLIGQKPIHQYLATKSDQDAFYGLYVDKATQSTKLQTWDILTGKLWTEWEIQPSLTDFEQFVPDNGDPMNIQYGSSQLIVSIKPIKQDSYNESVLAQYFGPHLLQSQFQNHTSYHMAQLKEGKINLHIFKIVEIMDATSVKTHLTFEYHRLPNQMFYFNKSKTLMLEWGSNDIVVLFKRHDQGLDSDNVPIVQWMELRRMQHLNKRFGNIEILENVSPDFEYFVDVDLGKKVFIIRHLQTEEPVLNLKPIPRYLLDVSKDYSDNAITECMMRIQWADNLRLKIISQSGMVKVIDVFDEFKQVQFNQVHNFDFNIERQSNFFFRRPHLQKTQVLERMIRKCQNYKLIQLLRDNPLQVENEEEGKILEDQKQVYYQQMFTVEKSSSKFTSDLSFSFLNWRTIELIQNNQIKMTQLDIDTQRQLVFAILPEGNTIWHLLSTQSEVDNMDQLARSCFSEDQQLMYSLPYFQNMAGLCPVSLGFKENQLNFVNQILKYLSWQYIDHSSRYLSKYLSQIISSQLNNFDIYLQSRSIQPDDVQGQSRKTIRQSVSTPGITVADFWSSRQLIDAKLFERDETSQDQQDIKLWYIDISKLQEFGDEGQEFFAELNNCDNFNIFDIVCIQQLINFKWPAIKRCILLYQFIPQCIFVILNIIYTSKFFESDIKNAKGKNKIETESSSSEVLFYSRLICCLYFLVFEGFQIKQTGTRYYFTQIWNFIDWVPPLLIIVIQFVIKFSEDHQVDSLAILTSFSMFAVLLKFLYFMRIFESTNFLVRAIQTVALNMIYFLLILVIVTASFGEAFRVMSLTNEEKDQFVSGNGDSIASYLQGWLYSYHIAMGDFGEFGQVGTWYVLLLFVLNTLTTTVIMLNLLIAIISESFNKINSQGVQASYREKAGLISENQFLLTQTKKDQWCASNQYLLYCQVIEITEGMQTQEFQLKQSIENQSSQIISLMTQQFTSLNDKLISNENSIQELVKDFDQFKTKFSDLTNDVAQFKNQLR